MVGVDELVGADDEVGLDDEVDTEVATLEVVDDFDEIG